MDAARQRGRYGHRDTMMILVAYRHGLRVSELCALRWDQVDFAPGYFTCAGSRTEHPACIHLAERKFARYFV
jgi:integrase